MAHLATAHSVRCYNRYLFLTCFALFTTLFGSQTAMAQTTYYVSTAGNDNNNGTSPSTPWRTIDTVNQIGSNPPNGTTVLFKTGETFRGSIQLANGNNLTLGTYPANAAPAIIKGSTAVPNNAWTLDGAGRYYTNLVPAPDYVSHVYQGGNLLQLARYPNVDNITPENSWLYNDDGFSFIRDAALILSRP